MNLIIVALGCLGNSENRRLWLRTKRLQGVTCAGKGPLKYIGMEENAVGKGIQELNAMCQIPIKQTWNDDRSCRGYNTVNEMLTYSINEAQAWW